MRTGIDGSGLRPMLLLQLQLCNKLREKSQEVKEGLQNNFKLAIKAGETTPPVGKLREDRGSLATHGCFDESPSVKSWWAFAFPAAQGATTP
jgi:hypothetical protein